MQFYEMAKARYSVRHFDGRHVKKNKLKAILEAGRIAPTAKNNQPQKIYVLESGQAIEKINKVCKCIYGASTVLLVCYDQKHSMAESVQRRCGQRRNRLRNSSYSHDA